MEAPKDVRQEGEVGEAVPALCTLPVPISGVLGSAGAAAPAAGSVLCAGHEVAEQQELPPSSDTLCLLSSRCFRSCGVSQRQFKARLDPTAFS